MKYTGDGRRNQFGQLWLAFDKALDILKPAFENFYGLYEMYGWEYFNNINRQPGRMLKRECRTTNGAPWYCIGVDLACWYETELTAATPFTFGAITVCHTRLGQHLTQTAFWENLPLAELTPQLPALLEELNARMESWPLPNQVNEWIDADKEWEGWRTDRR
jgi:hypothetical protein